jgi:hypothetical protein
LPLNSALPVQMRTAPRLASPLSSRSGPASCLGQRRRIPRLWQSLLLACWCRRYSRCIPCRPQPACGSHRNSSRSSLDCRTLRAVRNSISFILLPLFRPIGYVLVEAYLKGAYCLRSTWWLSSSPQPSCSPRFHTNQGPESRNHLLSHGVWSVSPATSRRCRPGVSSYPAWTTLSTVSTLWCRPSL